jgi:hypothetical protein
MRFVEGLAIRQIRRRTGAASGDDPASVAFVGASELCATVVA